uniref:Uncharacterized protein n=1 Tax=Fagus sylvatica TaxID=28930 RepID=A0A2N9FZB0_FAGSY
MPKQRRSINIGSVLGTLAPESSETSDLPPAPRFPEGESVMKKRKKGEEGVEGVREQQALVQIEPSVTKSPSKKGKGKNSRAPQKAIGHVSHKRKHQKELPAPWSCEFYVNGRPVNEDDSVWKSKDVRGGQIADAVGRAFLPPKDMRAWQGNNSTQMIENLKRDSVVAGSRLIETERLLNESLIENDRLYEVEKTASTRVQEVENQHRTAEEGLQTAECQLAEISVKLERECTHSSEFQAEIKKFRAELVDTRMVAQNAENAAQAFYDQGFEEAAESLKLQLRRECNIYFLKGWVSALERAEAHPDNLEEVIVEAEAVEDPMDTEAVEVLRHQDRVQTEGVQDVEKSVSDKEDNVNVDDKEFTAKKVEFVERRMVEHLLKKPCFIDSGGRPRAASILLEFEPSYKFFQKGLIVKNFGQAEVTVSQPGKEVGHPVIRFPSFFDPTLSTSENMPIQRQSIDIASVLWMSAPEPSGTSPSAPPPRFSEGEDAKAPKKGKNRNDRALQKAAGQVSRKHKHQINSKQLWSCAFIVDGQAVDEGDSYLKGGDVRGGKMVDAVGKALLLPEDMKVWQEKRSKHMLENLKRDSILSQKEIKSLKDLEMSASAKIRAAKTAHKSAKAGLMNMEHQVTKLKKELDLEFTSGSQLRLENNRLKDTLNEARAEVQKAKGEAQSYYDQGFEEAANSLRSQLSDECNKFFVQGWHKALDKAGVDDASKLYDLAHRHQPFEEGSTVPKPHEAVNEPELAVDLVMNEPESAVDPVMNEPELAVDPGVAEGSGHLEADDRFRMVEVHEDDDDSDEENLDVLD